MKTIPIQNDKVKIISGQFVQNSNKLHQELKNYENSTIIFSTYYKNMEEVNKWLKQKESVK